MPSLVLLVGALLAALVCVRAPIRWAAIVLFASVFLVPDTLPVPQCPASFTVARLLVWASMVGLLLRVSGGEIPSSALRPSRVHLVLAGFVVMAYLVGVSWAPLPADFHSGYNQWLLIVDQLLFFWCAVTYTRVIGVRWVATLVVGLAATSAGIGVVERLQHGSYAHWWFRHASLSVRSQSPAFGLETRNGPGTAVRSRAAAEFALEYGWVLTMMVPLACAIALRSRRWYAWVAPPLLVIAIVFSVSRSVFGGLALAAVVWVVLSRFDRRVVLLATLGGVAFAFLYLGSPGLRQPYQAASPNSLASRTRREQFVAVTVVRRPYAGVGLSGLSARAVDGTDSTYVLVYGTMGVIGLVGLGAILVTPIGVAGLGALGGDGPDRFIGAAAAAGLSAAALSGGAYDMTSGPTSTWPFWLLAAVGLVAAERVAAQRVAARASAGPARRRRLSPVRLAVPVAGAVAGLAWVTFATTRVTVASNFWVYNPQYLGQPGDPFYSGQVAVDSVCTHGLTVLAGRHVQVVCRPDGGFAAGLGYLQVSGANSLVVASALQAFNRAAVQFDAPYLWARTDSFDLKPAIARTAPGWLAATGLLLILIVPPLPIDATLESLRRVRTDELARDQVTAGT